MNDPHETRQPAPSPITNPRDVQRIALRNLLDLSPDAVRAVESKIEMRLEIDRADARDRFDELSRRIEKRFRHLSETGHATYRTRVAEIQRRFDGDLEAVETERRTTRDRVASEAETAVRNARQALDQDVWLADSVVEATKTELKKELDKIKQEAPGRIRSLTAIRDQADRLLEDYRIDIPGDAGAVDGEAPPDDDPANLYRQGRAAAREDVARLAALPAPRMFKGARPYMAVILPCAVVSGLAGWASFATGYGWPTLGIHGLLGLAVTLAATLVAGHALRRAARTQALDVYVSLHRNVASATAAVERHVDHAAREARRREDETLQKRDTEVQTADERFEEFMAEIGRRRAKSLKRIEEKHAAALAEAEDTRDVQMQGPEAWRTRFPSVEERYRRYQEMARRRLERREADCQARHDRERADIEQSWAAGLDRLRRLLDDTPRLDADLHLAWNDPAWQTRSPPTQPPAVVRFGELEVDMNKIAGRARRFARGQLDFATVLRAPAMLAMPDRGSMLIQTGSTGRDEALEALQTVMIRLLTSFPPGRVHFTIIDPIGLGQNFAGFMHLADHDDALVGGRIWTEISHIEQRLADLTTHMENVIQKYLRNEFESIDAYNAQAGELAEPYRFLVIANYPANFSEEAARRLASIVHSGARCGVYTLIAHDTRQALPAGVEMEDVAGRSVHLVYTGDRFLWNDRVFRHFPLTFDRPPDEATLTRILHRIGSAAEDVRRVEVAFDVIAPAPEQDWSGDAAKDVRIPLGRAGATRLQHLTLGRGVAQHVLIAGKTGSGKSTLLHVIVTNLALWYSPDEVEVYLVDFKKGVEFKTYAVHHLPHARAIAIESDREFGISVLQRLDAEMERRGNLYRTLGVQDLPAYRQKAAGAEPLPRTLLIIDEFQVFFSEDDKLAQDAAMLLDRLVRQGRAFGIHVLLGSQTLAGAAGLARSTIGQMAIRVALQCSEADSQLILNDDNTAARLLNRPGEALYNDAGGLVEGNSPFQTAWLSEATRDVCLKRVSALAKDRPERREPTIVFEGNAPADIRTNRRLADLVAAGAWGTGKTPPRVWLGDAISIKEPTAVDFRRQSGANLLIVGQRDDAAAAMLCAAMVACATQQDRGAAFVVLDGTPADSRLAGVFQRVAACLPHATQLVEWRDAAKVLGEVVAEVRRRIEAGQTDADAVFLIVHGLQRYRVLRRDDDAFALSLDEERAATAKPDRDFAEVLRDGPPVGIHVLVWSDTPATLERSFDRQTLREFDNRVLFQMSAGDSSSLIDSPIANKLGFYRALFHSEEQGVLEKFRPYALPEQAWLEHVRRSLEKRS